MGKLIFHIGLAILLAPNFFGLIAIPAAPIVGAFVIWLGVLLVLLGK